MPSKSTRQRNFFGLELAKHRDGEATETGLGEDTLREFARSPGKGRPRVKRMVRAQRRRRR